MKKGIRRIIGIGLIILLAVVIVIRLNKPAEVPDPVAPPSVSVTRAESGTIELSTGLVGIVEPSDVVYVAPKISGDVLEVMVKTGDTVSEGQALCRIDNSESIDGLRIQLDAASVALSDAKTNLQRMQILYSTGDISAQAYEQAQSGVKSAQLQYDSAKLNYDNQIKHSVVTAPIGGLVESFDIEVHDNISSSDKICVISGHGEKTVSFSVTERIMGNLSVGDEIKIEKLGSEYLGRITEISSMIDAATGLFKVKAVVENGDALPTGATVKLYVISDRANEVMTLPVDVIYYDGGEASVYTFDNGTIHKMPVEVGIYDSEKIQILSGITQEDLVITTWSSELYEGAPAVLAEGTQDGDSSKEPVQDDDTTQTGEAGQTE